MMKTSVIFYLNGQKVHAANVSTPAGFGRALQKAKAAGDCRASELTPRDEKTGREIWAYDFAQK